MIKKALIWVQGIKQGLPLYHALWLTHQECTSSSSHLATTRYEWVCVNGVGKLFSLTRAQKSSTIKTENSQRVLAYMGVEDQGASTTKNVLGETNKIRIKL